MMEEPTNKELMHYIKDIRQTVSDIKEQTIKTNGRVSSLEVWKGVMIGGLAVITVMIVPLILNLLSK